MIRLISNVQKYSVTNSFTNILLAVRAFVGKNVSNYYNCQNMKLLVFCHQGLAYSVPNKVFLESEKHDINYEKFACEKAKTFFNEIQKKYKPVKCYLLTADSG